MNREKKQKKNSKQKNKTKKRQTFNKRRKKTRHKPHAGCYLVTFLMLTHSLSKLTSRKHYVALTHSKYSHRSNESLQVYGTGDNFLLCEKPSQKKNPLQSTNRNGAHAHTLDKN